MSLFNSRFRTLTSFACCILCRSQETKTSFAMHYISPIIEMCFASKVKVSICLGAEGGSRHAAQCADWPPLSRLHSNAGGKQRAHAKDSPKRPTQHPNSRTFLVSNSASPRPAGSNNRGSLQAPSVLPPKHHR